MRPTYILRAAHARTPMIKFLGKRHTPKQVDHTPQPHPASPTHELPESFASYRQKATQHGPLKSGPQPNGGSSSSPNLPSVTAPSSLAYGAIGGSTGRSLGSIKPKAGEFFDRSELPKRFQRTPWSEEEMDAITTGGASMWS